MTAFMGVFVALCVIVAMHIRIRDLEDDNER